MHPLSTAISKSLHNWRTPGLLKIFFWCFMATLGALVAFIIAATWLIGALIPSTPDEPTLLITLLSGFGATVVSWMLFPLLYPVIIGFFDQEMAAAIEKRDYPNLPEPTKPFWPNLWHDAKFSVKALFLNILVLPLYFFVITAPFVYYGLNGYLLGKQFFMMAAGRQAGKDGAHAVYGKNRLLIFLAGAAIAFSATIPFVNLFAPFFGVAVMIHLYHVLDPHNSQNNVKDVTPSA